jgi:hypothetical protein
MKIKTEYATLDEIPEAARPLYTQQNDKFVLTGVEGVKPVSEFERTLAAKRTETEAHNATKARLQAWGDLNPDEVLPTLDRIKALEAAAGGKLDEKAIDGLVEQRIGTRMGPIERAKKALETQLAEQQATLNALKTERRNALIRDAVTKAALAEKVIDTAVDDVVLLASTAFDIGETGAITARDTGLSIGDWLSDMKARRPHWWPASRGGGAAGSGAFDTGAGNPWTKENFNLTRQGEIFTKNPEQAERMKAAAQASNGRSK